MSFTDGVLVAVAVLSIGGVLRILVGPTVWDRLLGLGLISSKIVVAIAIFAYALQRTFLLDIAIIYSLLGFIASVLIARFIEERR